MDLKYILYPGTGNSYLYKNGYVIECINIKTLPGLPIGYHISYTNSKSIELPIETLLNYYKVKYL